MITVIIMTHCNGSLNGKYWLYLPKTVRITKVSVLLGPDYRGTTVFRIRENRLKYCGGNYLNRSFIRQSSHERDRKCGQKI